MLTTTTAYFLIKPRKYLAPQSVGLVNALICLTYQTAAPATVRHHGHTPWHLIFRCHEAAELKSASSSFTPSTTASEVWAPRGLPAVVVYLSSHSSASAGVNLVLPKFYACSMMWTLNARTDIRATHFPSDIHSVSCTQIHSVERGPSVDAVESMSRQSELPIIDAFPKQYRTPAAKNLRFSMAFTAMTEGSDAGIQSEDMVFAPREM
ncbi:hypothetical protein C8R44DRAFT_982091 [Mycena epipterygia]|nr:hypothetical protein C8R44DRAFT_982091 [Mycena epipterygia]